MVAVWEKKVAKVIASLHELPDTAEQDEGSPLDRSTLLEEKEDNLKALEKLAFQLTNGHQKLSEALSTYRALTTGLKKAKSPKPGSREAEIREIIKVLERKLTHFSDDIEKLPMEGPSTNSILKLLSSLDF